MFHKSALLTLCSLFVLASAAPPAAAPAPPPAPLCTTGDAKCCNTVTSANDPAAANLQSLLGIVVQDVTVPVGLGCTPISVIGLGQGANCAQQPVCCSQNNWGGLISVGCNPIST